MACFIVWLVYNIYNIYIYIFIYIDEPIEKGIKNNNKTAAAAATKSTMYDTFNYDNNDSKKGLTNNVINK